MYRKIIVTTLAVLFVIAVTYTGAGAAVPPPPPAVTARLTSITIDREDASGSTTNAPGAWSTNLADPLSQVGIFSQGKFLNIPQPAFALVEIDIPLVEGKNKFTLYGTGNFPLTAHYGAVLFFDGRQVGPQIAVYSANGSTGAFSVQAKGTSIMGGANGGWFFDYAPGTSTCRAGNGLVVAVTNFTINAVDSTVDKASHYTIGPDGVFDAVAKLEITVVPANDTDQDCRPQ